MARRVDGRIMGGMLLMTMGGFEMAHMMWQCWVQAESDRRNPGALRQGT